MVPPSHKASTTPFKPTGFLQARLSPDSYLGLHLSIGIAVLLLAVFLFVNIAEDLREPKSLLLVFDQQAMLWMQAHATPGRTAFFLFMSRWHNTLGILVMTTIFALWLAHRRAWDWVLRVLLSIPLGMLLNVLLKNIFQRQRPVLDHPLLTLMSYSFPSGHTAAATLFYAVMAGWLLTVFKLKWRALVVAFAVVMVALVALSRVYLGVHYPSDVLAAVLSSSAWLAMVLTGVSTWRKRQCWLIHQRLR
jgi:membrane-associated phospholipid phosphatase